ncbi:MAG: transposase [Methanothrix sp.]
MDCAKTIKQHWNGIINYIKTKIDNGILEGTIVILLTFYTKNLSTQDFEYPSFL